MSEMGIFNVPEKDVVQLGNKVGFQDLSSNN